MTTRGTASPTAQISLKEAADGVDAVVDNARRLAMGVTLDARVRTAFMSIGKLVRLEHLASNLKPPFVTCVFQSQ
eukprot:CAMPEP_0172170456 /NCGR_PEP_ID=MMETSP1050-20130122/11277_1 /TAXON_ID=233186 /ORGANISM="Cryptomonas curvata, Strain CCAP979/52" /LENGTH=74 /DNA_ID=CAMNT_0012841639 /DNA_START=816 /DNA_END=1037 /DNA_ORIENTATION=+